MPSPRSPATAGLCIALLVVPWVARAQTDPPPACIEVEVNGERIRDYDCFSRLLAPAAASAAPAQAPGSLLIVRQPPSALGLAHRAATQQRMGNTFGISTQPQRPPPPPPPVRPGR
ncbi:MAG TPA: hypothetical protein DCX91_15200 [Stenotrophomonas sp.]|nr:hypothetical protein [Stenotrophomonas sp.]